MLSLFQEEGTQSIADSLKAAAQDALNKSGFVYDENSGLYYDHNSGYYYDAVSRSLKLRSTSSLPEVFFLRALYLITKYEIKNRTTISYKREQCEMDTI